MIFPSVPYADGLVFVETSGRSCSSDFVREIQVKEPTTDAMTDTMMNKMASTMKIDDEKKEGCEVLESGLSAKIFINVENTHSIFM